MENKTERIYDLINFAENEVLPKLEYIQSQIDELFPELKDIRHMNAFKEKIGAKLKKDDSIGNVLKVLAENIQKHEFISEAYEAKTELLYHLLGKILKGNLKSAIDERALANFISTLTKAGYDFNYTSDRITIEKTWKANYEKASLIPETHLKEITFFPTRACIDKLSIIQDKIESNQIKINSGKKLLTDLFLKLYQNIEIIEKHFKE